MTTLCCLFEALLIQGGPELNMDSNRLNSLIATTFLFSFVWSIGGNLVEKCMDMFDSFARELFADCQDVRVSMKIWIKFLYPFGMFTEKFNMFVEYLLQQPSAGDLYGYFVDLETRRLEPWEKITPSFRYSPEVCLYLGCHYIC